MTPCPSAELPDRGLPSGGPVGGGAFDRLCRAVVEAWPPHRFADVTTMIAVSGGADSVGMLRALARLRLPTPQRPSGTQTQSGGRGQWVVLHYNHRLRGEHSDADERFVADLAGSLGLDCEIGRAAEAGPLPPQTVAEASLRGERYAFFDAAAHRRGARYVVTAHTADDNVETVLHNLFRGTGPAGLAGMPAFRDLGAEVVLVRPLLAVRRQEIRDALEEIGQPWREDASNRDQRWQRNWLRGFLLPEIRTRYPDADEAIGRVMRQQAEALDSVRAAASQWSAENITSAPGGPLRVGGGPAAPRAVVVAALRDAWDACGWPRGAMAERHWKAVVELITPAPGSPGADPIRGTTLNLPGGLRAKVLDRGSVVVAAIRGD